MNKRNTIIAIAVLVVLVVFLIGRSFFRHCHKTTITETCTSQVDLLLDLNLATGFDSATVEACDLPIVVHYSKPTTVNGSRTTLHIFSLTPEVLKGLANPDKGGVMPDSTQGIHIYPKFLRSKTSSINLGFYINTSMKEDVQYVVTYPVKDSLGLRVVEDSGMVSTEMNWKSYGIGTKAKNKHESETEMTKRLEQSLIRDVAKKMEEKLL